MFLILLIYYPSSRCYLQLYFFSQNNKNVIQSLTVVYYSSVGACVLNYLLRATCTLPVKGLSLLVFENCNDSIKTSDTYLRSIYVNDKCLSKFTQIVVRIGNLQVRSKTKRLS